MVRLSPQYGVNPMLGVCFICNTENGNLHLLGQLPGDAEAPRKAVVDMEPCEKCKECMQIGIILISVHEPTTQEDVRNPYRTGGWVVVKEEMIRRIFQPPEFVESVCTKRMAFVPDSVWYSLGLPLSPTQVEERFKLRCDSTTAPATTRTRRSYRLTCTA